MIGKVLYALLLFLGSILLGLRIEHVFGKNLSEFEETFVFMFNIFRYVFP